MTGASEEAQVNTGQGGFNHSAINSNENCEKIWHCAPGSLFAQL